MKSQIKQLKVINDRIQVAADNSNRSASEITVIGVTKGQHINNINEFIKYGLSNIGANYVQEAEKAFQFIKPKNINLTKHFIGRLQRNKVKKAISLFDTIVVDRLSVIKELQKRLNSEKNHIIPYPILLQVNLAKEQSKSGCNPEETFQLIQFIADSCPSLSCTGLMTVAPNVTNKNDERIRLFYRNMTSHKENIQENFSNIKELSMGMSDTFEIAVEEGATIVRLGTVLFGPRSYKSQ